MSSTVEHKVVFHFEPGITEATCKCGWGCTVDDERTADSVILLAARQHLAQANA